MRYFRDDYLTGYGYDDMNTLISDVTDHGDPNSVYMDKTDPFAAERLGRHIHTRMREYGDKQHLTLGCCLRSVQLWLDVAHGLINVVPRGLP